MSRHRDVEVIFDGLEGRGIQYNQLRSINGKGLSIRYYFTEEGILITFRHHNSKMKSYVDYDYNWNGELQCYYNYKEKFLIEKDDEDNNIRTPMD
jgi:hypothetical protein